MFPYYCLIIIPLLFSVVRVKTKSEILYDRQPLIVFFLIFITLLSLRSVNCGADLVNYRFKFENISYSVLQSLAEKNKSELGFYLFALICKSLNHNYQFFLFTCALVSVVPIMLLYIRETKHDVLSISLFISLSPFTLFFSGLRQSIAIGIGIFCYIFCKKDRLLLFLFCVALAFSFHQSAIVLLLLYLVCMIFNKRIFSFMLGLNEKYESRYFISDTGSYTYLILILLLVVYSFIIPTAEGDLISLRNILVTILFFQCFAPINIVAMRLNYYFTVFIPIAIPKIIDDSKEEYRQLAMLSSVIFTCFFIFWFFKECYTGSNYLQTVPYEAFWEAYT